MSNDNDLVSKVLVLDSDPACYEKIKTFCEKNNLVGLKGPSSFRVELDCLNS